MTKVVLIGAASASFGPGMIADAVLTPAFHGQELALVDLDGTRLQTMAAYARRVSEATGAALRINATTEREEALPGADVVITAIAVRRDELWRLDHEIPLKHGIAQVLGENGGPGGLSHALRNIPLILDIAADVERLCPQALLANFTNPESRICLALSRYSRVRFVGLCHGIGMGYGVISRLTGVPADDIAGTAAGLNHFGWYLDLRRRSTGEDLYPLLRAREARHDAAEFPLLRHLYHLYGLFPHPSDDHIGEYLSYAHAFCGTEGYDFARADRRREAAWERVERVARGAEEVPPVTGGEAAVGAGRGWLRRSGEFAFDIVAAEATGQPALIEAANLRNGGAIANLPDWAVVEVPAVAARGSLRPMQVGALPEGIVALLSAQVQVQSLVVDAAVEGSRQLALQALLADPVVSSARAAEACLDELLRVHAPYLPRFA